MYAIEISSIVIILLGGDQFIVSDTVYYQFTDLNSTTHSPYDSKYMYVIYSHANTYMHTNIILHTHIIHQHDAT